MPATSLIGDRTSLVGLMPIGEAAGQPPTGTAPHLTVTPTRRDWLILPAAPDFVVAAARPDFVVLPTPKGTGMQQSAESLENIRYEVRATRLGASYDPSSDVVEFGFTPGTDTTVPPASTVDGAWEVIGTGANTRYYAVCLVGPGGTTLTAGEYVVWLRIGDDPQVPYNPVNILTIT